MIQVNVTNAKTSQIGWSSEFPDQTTANAWIAQCEAAFVWGMPARTLTENLQGQVIDLNGLVPNLSLATSTGTTTDENGNTLNTYTFAADYSVASVDISAQVALQASIQKGLQCQVFGATVIAQVYAYNESNLASGALTTAQFNAMLADTTIANIERLLSNGSLSTALSLINSYTTTLETYFSSAQVSAIAAAISGSGLV